MHDCFRADNKSLVLCNGGDDDDDDDELVVVVIATDADTYVSDLYELSHSLSK